MGRHPVIGKKKALVNRVIFINGIGRAGKFLLGKIMSGFESIEYFQYISVIEHIPYLLRFGCISEDAAAALMQVAVDEQVYNVHIGRGLNFRADDASSIYNSHEVDLYLKRAKTPLNEAFKQQMLSTPRRPLFLIHSNLPNIDVFFKTFKNVEWIELVRHPLDLVYSWHNRGWGQRICSDPFSFTPSLQGNNGLISWFAYDWKEEYDQLNDMDRIIRSIDWLMTEGMNVYRKNLNIDRPRALFIKYEDLVERTALTIERIAQFLQCQVSSAMPAVLARERCPGAISLEDRSRKEEIIRQYAGKKMFRRLQEMSEEYEKGTFE